MKKSPLPPFVHQKSFFTAHGMRRSTSGHLDAWCAFHFPLFHSLNNLQIFEFTTGNALFEYKPYPKYALDETTAHLWQMLCFTRERITRQQIKASKLGAQYFDLAVNPDDIDNPFCQSSPSVILILMTYTAKPR
jgi:hypothetical protein